MSLHARLLLAVLVALPAATGAAPPDAAVAVELTVVGGPQLNPNAQGKASSVVVRLFELGSAPAFEHADYTAVFERPSEPLRHTVVAQEEFVLRPGDIQKHDRELPAQVKTLGIAAAFRDIDHAVWHLTVDVRPGRRNFILVDLDQSTVRLVSVDPNP